MAVSTAAKKNRATEPRMAAADTKSPVTARPFWKAEMFPPAVYIPDLSEARRAAQ